MEGEPNSMPESSTFSAISMKPVGTSSMYTAKISTPLLSPSLMPGMPALSGMSDST